MSFLPEELSSPEERLRMLELPALGAAQRDKLIRPYTHTPIPIRTYHYVAPLVDTNGEVPVRLDPLSDGRVHDGFRCGPHGNGLSQL